MKIKNKLTSVFYLDSQLEILNPRTEKTLLLKCTRVFDLGLRFETSLLSLPFAS